MVEKLYELERKVSNEFTTTNIGKDP